jgi:hypothetical protein
MAHMSTGGGPGSRADLANKGLRVLVLYERGAAGSRAVDQARELIQAQDGRLTVVTLAPSDTRVRGTGVSARDYNDAVRESAQRELDEARRLLGSLAERVVEVVSEGGDMSLGRGRRFRGYFATGAPTAVLAARAPARSRAARVDGGRRAGRRCLTGATRGAQPDCSRAPHIVVAYGDWPATMCFDCGEIAAVDDWQSVEVGVTTIGRFRIVRQSLLARARPDRPRRWLIDPGLKQGRPVAPQRGDCNASITWRLNGAGPARDFWTSQPAAVAPWSTGTRTSEARS